MKSSISWFLTLVGLTIVVGKSVRQRMPLKGDPRICFLEPFWRPCSTKNEKEKSRVAQRAPKVWKKGHLEIYAKKSIEKNRKVCQAAPKKGAKIYIYIYIINFICVFALGCFFLHGFFFESYYDSDDWTGPRSKANWKKTMSKGWRKKRYRHDTKMMPKWIRNGT